MSASAERLFIDSSIFIAILLEEPEGGAFATRIDAAAERYTSPVTIMESVMRLSTLLEIAPTDAETDLRALLVELNVRILDVTDATTRAAVVAFERFGKGRHEAKLNFGDCLAYGSAREHHLTLLYKGNDFARTDPA